MEDYIKYLQPEVVAQLSSMELRARRVVEGFITGLHRSSYHGFSVEFSEHRQYIPGDDIKRIDWKVYGKTDRFYIKQFEEETNVKTYLLVDVSASMGFRSQGLVSKYQYASYLAGSLAFLMISQRDAVGLMLFDESLRVSLQPRATSIYLKNILIELEKATPSNLTQTSKALNEVAEQIRRRGLVILLSDLFDNPSEIMMTLKHFRHKGHEVIVFHIVDPVERTFAFESDVKFIDVETKEELVTQPWHIRKAYQEAVKEYFTTMKEFCLNNLIDYVMLETSEPFYKALHEYLHKRQRMQ